MKTVLLLLFVAAVACAQLGTGELRLSITDATGLPLPSSGTLVSDAPRIEREFESNDAGQFTFQHLPSGRYRLAVRHPGFAPSFTLVEIRSGVPVEIYLRLIVQPAST